MCLFIVFKCQECSTGHYAVQRGCNNECIPVLIGPNRNAREVPFLCQSCEDMVNQENENKDLEEGRTPSEGNPLTIRDITEEYDFPGETPAQARRRRRQVGERTSHQRQIEDLPNYNDLQLDPAWRRASGLEPRADAVPANDVCMLHIQTDGCGHVGVRRRTRHSEDCTEANRKCIGPGARVRVMQNAVRCDECRRERRGSRR